MLNPTDPLSLATALVRIPSESSDPVATDLAGVERQLVAYLAALCREARVEHRTSEVRPGRENLLVRLPNPGAPRLLIVAHLDTVSGKGMASPFGGELREGCLWGRGACDDKGPLAAALSAILDLHGRGIKPCFDLTFVGTVDEECSMAGAEQLAREIDGFELCLALEPTDLKVINAHKGVYRFVVITRGRAVHSSHPEKGENAINRMLPILLDLQAWGAELAECRHPRLGQASLAITRLQGGASLNIIPDYCEAGVDVRLLPEMTAVAMAARVRELIGERGEVVEVYTGEGINTEMDDPLIDRFMTAIRAEGVEPGPITASFATDCSRLHQLGPCLVWGPGDIAQAHQLDEHIPVSQLERASAILKNFLTGGTL
ncbi:MAG TPA: M20 family metallopeptidase [Desulfurivibrionaceae bacterium]|nr:M20 family metallopeptidase [Desulfurivibrionaceae bacterium]